MADEPVTREDEDRFARLAEHYDRWIGWPERLRKEMPYLLSSVEGKRSVLDVGCGTGVHARALSERGFRVTGLDRAASMLEQARNQPGSERVEWVEGDVNDPAVLRARTFDAVMAVGNTVLAFGDEQAVFEGIARLVRLVAPGGLLVLQYLNVVKIREAGRLAVKASGPEAGPTSGATSRATRAESEGHASATKATDAIWLRHHFEASGGLRLHSYLLALESGAWTVDVRVETIVDLTPERIEAALAPHFERMEFFDGLTGRPFLPLESDAIGVRASGRRDLSPVRSA